MTHQDIGGKVGTALASIGSFIAAFVQSDIIINELVRLLSSCMIAAVGAAIGYYITRLLRRLDEKSKGDIPPINVGAVAPSTHSSKVRKAMIRKRYAQHKPKDQE